MKGFYIFEESINQLQKEASVACFKLGDISHIFNTKLEPNAMVSAEVEITALVENTITKATTNEDEAYDFETGALISLMKMCGVDKVVRACNEAFPKETYNTYITKYERELHELKKDFDKVKDLKDFYKKNYEDIKEHYGKLGDRNKYLIDDINKKLGYIKEKDEEIKKLKSDKDKSWKNYQRKIQKKQDRINELNNIEEEYIKLREDYDSLFEEKEKLQHDYNLCLNSENALKYTVESLNKSVAKLNKAIEGYKNDLYKVAKHTKELEEENKELHKNIDELFEDNKYWKSEAGRLSFEKHRLEEENKKLKDEVGLKNDAINEWKQTLRERTEKIGDLVCENYKLKTDCEKLQHGYIDNETIFCGGRQNGKQFTFLVDLFKKLDQKKVDAAYKEAYGKRTIWCSSQSSTRDMLDSLLDSCKYAILTDKDGEKIEKWTGLSEFTWELKMPTKREQKWERILKSHKENDVIIKVKKEDINTFWHELEERIPEITWCCGAKIFESKLTRDSVQNNAKKTNAIYFRVRTNNWLSYASDPCIYKGFEHISYLPPMRWDLFKKGRLAVKVNYNNYKEFYDACERELGKRPVTAVFTEDFTVSICKKDGLFEIFTVEDQKKTGRKIVDWEDVR